MAGQTYPKTDSSIPGFPGSIPGFPGSIPGFPGSIPGFPGSIPGFPGFIPGFPGSTIPDVQTSNKDIQQRYPKMFAIYLNTCFIHGDGFICRHSNLCPGLQDLQWASKANLMQVLEALNK